LSGWIVFLASSLLLSTIPFHMLLRLGSFLIGGTVSIHHHNLPAVVRVPVQTACFRNCPDHGPFSVHWEALCFKADSITCRPRIARAGACAVLTRCREQVRMLVVLDGVMGAAIAPSIAERNMIFAPLQFVALLSSSPPGRGFIESLGHGEWEHAQDALPEALSSLFLRDSVTLAILSMSFLLQTLWHKIRRERWLVAEEERLAAKAERAAAGS
jgi:hypothetical protein